ncbi:TPA: hypothetical protein DCP76_00155 [Patescibacteria group bacterium]|nr:hypothetical protein [Patescibacteria group bacterium]
MNTDLKRILKEIRKKKCNKVGNKHPKVQGLKEIRAIIGLSLNDAILFWGLTDPGSDEEPWSRVAINNWFVYLRHHCKSR